MPNILILDDHAALRAGLRFLLLGRWPSAIIECVSTFDEAEAACQRASWNVAIVDMDLGSESGLSMIPKLKALHPGLEVLVYTMHKEEQVGLRAYRAGAKGFLNKSESPMEIFRAVQSLAVGKTYVSARMEPLLVSALSGADEANGKGELSNREWEVLRGLALGAAAKEIAYRMGISPKSVATYRSRILEKLSLKSNADLVRYAIQHKIEPGPPA